MSLVIPLQLEDDSNVPCSNKRLRMVSSSERGPWNMCSIIAEQVSRMKSHVIIPGNMQYCPLHEELLLLCIEASTPLHLDKVAAIPNPNY